MKYSVYYQFQIQLPVNASLCPKLVPFTGLGHNWTSFSLTALAFWPRSQYFALQKRGIRKPLTATITKHSDTGLMLKLRRGKQRFSEMLNYDWGPSETGWDAEQKHSVSMLSMKRAGPLIADLWWEHGKWKQSNWEWTTNFHLTKLFTLNIELSCVFAQN